MIKTRRLMDQKTEEDLTDMIMEQARKNNLTISNLKKIMDKVIQSLESNAIWEMGDPNVFEPPVSDINRNDTDTVRHLEQSSTSVQPQKP